MDERQKAWEQTIKSLAACKEGASCEDCLEKTHLLMPLAKKEIVQWMLKWSTFDKQMVAGFEVVRELQRVLEEKQKGEKEIVDLFKRVFSSCKIGQERIILHVRKGNVDFNLYGTYERKIVITRNGVGFHGKYDSRTNYITNFRDFIQLKRKEKDLLAQVQKNSKAKLLLQDLSDFLALLPENIEIADERLLLTLSTPIMCCGDGHIREANYLVVESTRMDIRLKLACLTKGKQRTINVLTDAACSERLKSELIALLAKEAEFSLGDVQNILYGGENYYITKLTRIDQEVFAQLEVFDDVRIFNVKNTANVQEMLMMLQLEPQLPMLLQQATDKLNEYVQKQFVLAETIRVRFAKQLLVSAL